MVKKVITAVAVFTLISLVVSLGLVMATPALADTVTLSPSAVGNFDQWTLGAGTSKVTAVSSNDGDASYIKTSTQGYRQTFAFPGASVPAGSTINSVTVKVVARRTTGGINQIDLVAEKGTGTSDISDGSILGVGATYAGKTRTMLTNPFTASAWTVSEVNSWTTGGQGIRFGVRLDETTNEVRVTQISVVVDYTPDVTGPTGGSTKDKYRTNEDVYVAGSGFLPDSDVDVYIVNDRAWSDGEEIGAYVEMDTFTADGDGNIGPVVIWSAPLRVGKYDVVFDAYQDGDYDELWDLVDDPNHPGFTVVSPTVGGEVHPVNKAALVMPWLGLTLVLILALGGALALRGRRTQ